MNEESHNRNSKNDQKTLSSYIFIERFSHENGEAIILLLTSTALVSQFWPQAKGTWDLQTLGFVSQLRKSHLVSITGLSGPFSLSTFGVCSGPCKSCYLLGFVGPTQSKYFQFPNAGESRGEIKWQCWESTQPRAAAGRYHTLGVHGLRTHGEGGVPAASSATCEKNLSCSRKKSTTANQVPGTVSAMHSPRLVNTPSMPRCSAFPKCRTGGAVGKDAQSILVVLSSSVWKPCLSVNNITENCACCLFSPAREQDPGTWSDARRAIWNEATLRLRVTVLFLCRVGGS